MDSSYTILVIEDDTHTLTLIHNALKGMGIDICHAKDSQLGLKMLAELRPQLILMDLLLPLPGMKSWEAIAFIKQQPEYSHIPVIAMSAGSYEIVELAQKAGCDAFLQKPFGFKDLRQAIIQFRPE